jgi:hypothetical protein
MIEGPADAIDEIVARTQEAMAEASAIVLDGFRLGSDVNIVRWPDRYMDGRGREFWDRVMVLLRPDQTIDRSPRTPTAGYIGRVRSFPSYADSRSLVLSHMPSKTSGFRARAELDREPPTC